MESVIVSQAGQIAASDFSMWSLFLRADLVVQLVMAGLVLASVWSWSIILEKSFVLRGVNKAADKFEALFWSGESLQSMYSQLSSNTKSPISNVFNAAMREWVRVEGGRKLDKSFTLVQTIERTLHTKISREMEGLEKRLLFLATVGSVAPFVGLFGTVWGIMNSFQAIAMTRDTNLAVVAPGIAEALFATGLGLLAAIPAVVAYNKFSQDLSKFGDRLDYFADDFTALIARQPKG